MKKYFAWVRIYIFRGLLAIIPLALSVLAIQFFYVVIDKRIVRWVSHFTGYSIPGLGILLFLIFLLLLGFLASNMLGKQIFGLIEKIANRLPIIKTTYQVGKQLSQTLSLPERQVFKKVVLVDFLSPGIWMVGFVTGTVVDRTKKNETLLKVFIPTTPNPTSGWLVLVKESDIRDPDISMEEAMKAVISGGIIGVEEIK